jgi:4-amino-4-deoxy-L-arabinose transferase-like glycosyltransferase
MWKYNVIIFTLLLCSYFLSIQQPLFGDEGLYSIAIKDNIELGLQPTATYFGEVMYWKPSLMFNIYAIIASPFYKIIPEEILFRTISLLFVIASLFVLFYYFKNEFNNEKKAYLGLIIILITPAFFGYSIRVLTDTLVFLFFAIVLYTSQKFEKYNKLFFLLSLVGIGLSKSIALSIMGIIMSLIYYYYKNKKINYEMILISIISIVIIFGYSEIIGINKLNTGDLSRFNNIGISITNILRYTYGTILFYGITLFAILFCKNKKNPIYIFVVLFIIYLIINKSIGLPWYIFPILPFITLLFLDVDLEKRKELIVILLIWNFIIISTIIGGLDLGNYNLSEAAKIDFNKSIYIGRLGEVVANKMYDYNGVMVTPQNSFQNIDNIMEGRWYGSREEMTKENLLGLIYDYENSSWYPPYFENLEVEDKYIPPIARTHKNWDGLFEQIIIEEQYYLRIENDLLKDYELIKIIGEEKEIDIEEKIYVLSIKENLE